MITCYADLGRNTHFLGDVQQRKKLNKSVEGKKAVAAKGLAKFMLLLAIMLLCFAFGAIVNAYASGPAGSHMETTPGAASTVVMVDQGDTLWSIAGTYAPDGADIREFVWQIKQANGLETSIIHEGEKLLIPIPGE